MAIILMAGVVTALLTRSVALAAATDPVTGQEGIYAVVPAPVPTSAPRITNLAGGSIITSSDPLSLQGNCPPQTLVKVYKNNVFAGSTFCQSGSFSLKIDLFFGANSLTLTSYNANDVAGPSSTPLPVTLSVPAVNGVRSPASAANQLVITSDAYYKGVKVSTPQQWTLTIQGGQAPYAVDIGWGDGTSDLISRGTGGSFTVQHTYQKAGSGNPPSYTLTAQATDQTGLKSFLQLSNIVSGNQTGVVSSLHHGYDLSRAIRLAWQSLLGLLLIILAFWLGERREAFVLRRAAFK